MPFLHNALEFAHWCNRVRPEAVRDALRAAWQRVPTGPGPPPPPLDPTGRPTEASDGASTPSGGAAAHSGVQGQRQPAAAVAAARGSSGASIYPSFQQRWAVLQTRMAEFAASATAASPGGSRGWLPDNGGGRGFPMPHAAPPMGSAMPPPAPKPWQASNWPRPPVGSLAAAAVGDVPSLGPALPRGARGPVSSSTVDLWVPDAPDFVRVFCEEYPSAIAAAAMATAAGGGAPPVYTRRFVVSTFEARINGIGLSGLM
jgi:hypothetical protein